ncbi:MAG: hypothetical protein WAU47_15815, partial [Desulfobaccales bacterium]
EAPKPSPLLHFWTRRSTMPRYLSLAFLTALLLGVLSSFPFEAQSVAAQPKFSSAFTNLSTDCRDALKSVGEGQDMPLKCKGYGQYYIYIYYSAFASHIAVKTKGNDDNTIHVTAEHVDFSDKGDSKVEWRLADGKPFAVIIKVSRYNKEVQDTGENPYQDKYKIGEAIIVKGLTGYNHIDFNVDARTPNAFAEARKLADDAYLKSRP